MVQKQRTHHDVVSLGWRGREHIVNKESTVGRFRPQCATPCLVDRCRADIAADPFDVTVSVRELRGQLPQVVPSATCHVKHAQLCQLALSYHFTNFACQVMRSPAPGVNPPQSDQRPPMFGCVERRVVHPFWLQVALREIHGDSNEAKVRSACEPRPDNQPTRVWLNPNGGAAIAKSVGKSRPCSDRPPCKFV